MTLTRESRIATTHTGSLPRPSDLIQAVWAAADGVPVDADALERMIGEAVIETVRRQVEAGITVVNDGEMSKPSYATYVQDRDAPARASPRDASAGSPRVRRSRPPPG